MLRLRRVVVSLWLMGLLWVCFASAQDLILRPSPPTELKLVQIGNEKTKSGVRTAFRIYRAPDGGEGKVSYIEFDSQQAAQKQIEEWINFTSKVTSREQDRMNKKGQLVSDRILAVRSLPDSHKAAFMTIRRDGRNCYLIESMSLQVAQQIEDLIYHK